MSTAYNRRRGAKANQRRKPRYCDHIFTSYPDPRPFNKDGRAVINERWCIRLAQRNRYCEEHQKC